MSNVLFKTLNICGYEFVGPFDYTETWLLREQEAVYVIGDLTILTALTLDIGETEALRSRITGHERKQCWVQNATGVIVVYAHYMPGSSAMSRRCVEKRLRDELKPPCGYY